MKLNRQRLLQPNWLILILSFGITLASVIDLALAYGLTRQWQFLALTMMSAVVLLIHGVAYGLMVRWKANRTAIFIIALVKILGAAFSPLYIANFWAMGVLLLAVVTVEVGIGDRLQRIPLFLVMVFLGASGMILTDLLTTFPRVDFVADLPGVFLILIGLALYLVFYLFLLRYYRLRKQSEHFVRIDIATQQSLIFAFTLAISIILVTGVLIARILQNQMEQVGSNFENVAEILGERAGIAINEQIESLSFLARVEPVLFQFLTAANESYPTDETAIDSLRQSREEQWATALNTDDFVLNIRNNDATFALSRFRGNAYAQNNLFVTDRYGGLVASQGEKPQQYYYHDEAWWQFAWNYGQGSVYVGNLQTDPVTKESFIFIAVGLINLQTNETVGVLASTLSLANLERDFQDTHQDFDGELLLLSREGVIIAGANHDDIGTVVSPALLKTLPLNQVALQSNWYLGEDRFGNSAVVSFAPLVTAQRVRVGALAELGWLVVVSDTQSNALFEVIRSIKIASFVALIAISLGIMASITLARVITLPIQDLTETAIEITKGNLQQEARLAGPNELHTLAQSFNSLTAQLRSLINDLQGQVEQRTQQLKARVDQLATLNRITQAVSSIHDTTNVMQTVAQEMVDLFDAQHCIITLLSSNRAELEVVMNYPQSEDQRSIIGAVITLSDYPATQHLIATHQSAIVADAVDNPITEPIHNFLRRMKIQALMIIPLITRGEVIGTIAIGTTDAQRVFTDQEIKLGETVAGQISGAIESVRVYSQAQEALAAAEAANESKSAFLASVSHELRTPLTSVLGYAKIIDKRLHERLFPLITDDSPRTRSTMQQVADNIKIIFSEGERLTALINNVLDLAKIEAGKVEWKMEPVGMKEVVERAMLATGALFEDKSLERRLYIPPNLAQVYGDRDRLIQVVVNYISNAVKFTDIGAITVQARQSSSEIIVEVIDTGTGIAREDHESVFERFKQVGDTLTNKPKGTGLGLPICKEIIEHHQGRIWLESELGKGSVFAFALPIFQPVTEKLHRRIVPREVILQELEQRDIQPMSIEPHDLPRVLLIDDDAAIRALYHQQLLSIPCTVIEAQSVEQALQVIEREMPDLIILDCVLPYIPGFHLVQTVRNSLRTMGIPIMIVSILEEQEAAYLLGVDAYMVKPVDTDVLVQQAQRLLERKLSRRGVLLVDDEAITEQLEALLHRAGHRIQITAASENIEKLIQQHRPDVLIVPEKYNGVIMNKLQANEHIKHLYLVAYT